jgi:hypothetical protein
VASKTAIIGQSISEPSRIQWRSVTRDSELQK